MHYGFLDVTDVATAAALKNKRLFHKLTTNKAFHFKVCRIGGFSECQDADHPSRIWKI